MDDVFVKGELVKNWTVDNNFKNIRKQCVVPDNPKDWSCIDVLIWMDWANEQFELGLNQSDWCMDGRQLCALTLDKFRKIVPSDPANKFWTHLELLRKCGLAAVPCSPKVTREDAILAVDTTSNGDVKSTREMCVIPKKGPPATPLPTGGNRSGNNGKIQLWQFLLEILTDRKYLDVICWFNDGGGPHDGSFKLLKPKEVATLWGARKNNCNMTYDKLSRVLRYYKDGDMITKVQGKRFVYRFVYDLKELMGMDAQGLADMVNGVPKVPRPRRYPNGCPPDIE